MSPRHIKPVSYTHLDVYKRQELKEVKTQLSDKQAQLEKHFAESAELFKTLIGDYQKLYRHYAVSSETLLLSLIHI